MEALKWSGRKQLPLIRQTESAECGLACLVMMACWHGLQTDLPTLRERFSKIRRKPSPNAGGDIRRKARRALGQTTPAYSD